MEFLKDIGKGIGGSLADRAGSWVGDKIFGIPKAKTTAQAAQESLEYMNIAFPGTTPWERLGGGGANAMSGVQTASAQRVNKRDELNNSKELMNQQNRNQLKIVDRQIQGQKEIAANTVSEARQRRVTVDTPVVAPKIAEIKSKTEVNTKQLRKMESEINNIDAGTKLQLQKILTEVENWKFKRADASIREIDLEWHRAVKAAKIVSGSTAVIGGAVAVGVGLNTIRKWLTNVPKKLYKKGKKFFEKPKGVPSPVNRINTAKPKPQWKVQTFGKKTGEKYDPQAMDPSFIVQ